MSGWAELQATVGVRSWVVPSLMVASAWSWLLFSSTRDIVAGIMLSSTATAGVTVRLADPVTDPALAVMVDVPAAVVVTIPVALTLAIADDELQVADCVKF